MIGEALNCMARTRDGRCAMCAVCRIVMALENVTIDVNVERNRALTFSIDAVNDTLREIRDEIETVGDAQ